MKTIALCILVLLIAATSAAQLPVVPGAPADYGMETRAAYACGTDPTIYKVTSLSDSGVAGTFRYAVTQSGPRVVVFEVSGYITISSSILISSPCLTIAGQTAPAPGVTIRASTGMSPGSDKGIYIATHDVLIQHFAIRPGATSCNSAIQLYTNTPYNVVFDHMSVSWGQDETIGIQGPAHDVMFWRTISAEGIYQAPGSNGVCDQFSNGHSLLVGGSGNGKVAVLQSLLAHTRERTPLLGDTTAFYFANNIIYSGHEGFGIEGGPVKASVINNTIKRRAGSGGDTPNAFLIVNVGAATDLYETGNTIDDGGLSPATSTFTLIGGNDPRQGSPPISAPSGYTPTTAAVSYASVLIQAGARPNERDAIDTRIVSDVSLRTSSNGHISSQDEVGGYPVLAENNRTFTPVGSPHVNSGSGYTNLEVQLHGMAATVEGEDPPVLPSDPGAATGVNVVTAHFTGTSGLDLTAYTSDTGGGWTFQAGSTGVLELDGSNRLMNSSVALGAATMSNATPTSAEYDVKGTLITTGTLTAGTGYALWGRALTGSETGYFFAIDAADQTASLRMAISGSYSLFGSCAHTFAINSSYEIILRIRNGYKGALIDGVQCWATTDNSISAMGKAGVSAFASSAADDATHGARWDDVIVTDVQAAPAPTLCAKCRLRFVR